jgi:hypothetical protein
MGGSREKSRSQEPTSIGRRFSFFNTEVQEKPMGIQPKGTFIFIAYNGNEAPRVKVYREGWEATSRTVADQLENLEEAGRVISLSLMIMGREIDY